ncbi:MAG: preprotein translocase subunit SecG [Desulfosalsimonadaceae bacterium]|nr:preprotein translocase subunit SecG [Desulfosalsimonadaceae bacterium]
MTALIITIHIIVSIALILIVLLQTGKGASMGAVFGGAGSQTLFGNTGAASFLGKMTTWAAVIFMITSLALAYISKSGGKSVVSDLQPITQQTQAPVAEKPPVSIPESPATPASEKPLSVNEPTPITGKKPVVSTAPISLDPAQPQAGQPAASAPVTVNNQKTVESVVTPSENSAAGATKPPATERNQN